MAAILINIKIPETTKMITTLKFMVSGVCEVGEVGADGGVGVGGVYVRHVSDEVGAVCDVRMYEFIYVRMIWRCIIVSYSLFIHESRRPWNDQIS